MTGLLTPSLGDQDGSSRRTKCHVRSAAETRRLLNHQEMLGSLKKDPQNDFSRDKNCLVDFLMSDSRREDVNIFVNIIWYNFFLLVEMHLSDNSDEFVLNI